MAFCNSCGATLVPGTKFCNKCGSPVAGASAAPATTPTAATTLPPPPKPSGGGALKVVLIVVAVIIAVGILLVTAVGVIGYKIAKSAHVKQQGDSVKVDTPIGSFSANDPDQAIKDLGVEIYPGAQVQKEGTASVSFGSLHTVTANFETTDPVDKVCEFYRSKFPAASVNTSDQDHCTVVSGEKTNTVTVNAQSAGSVTKFQIATVNRK